MEPKEAFDKDWEEDSYQKIRTIINDIKSKTNMPTLYMTKGLPASGKSTWAKERVSIDGNTKRINKDDLRLMLDNGEWSKNNEKFVLEVRDTIASNALYRDLMSLLTTRTSIRNTRNH